MQAWTTVGQPDTHPEPWAAPELLPLFVSLQVTRLRSWINISTACSILPSDFNSWLPPLDEIHNRTSAYLDELSNEFSGLVRICLFEDLLGISDRSAISDGNPVEGWLIHHRRPEPLAKSTADKDLYGALSELEIEKEDWVIIDPKDNDIRETATSNLIFCSGNELLIPEKFILQGVVLRQLLPPSSKISRSPVVPQRRDLSAFDEILLCGSGRGVAPLNALSELGWNSSGNETFNQVRQLHDSLIEQACA